jgi:ABC-type Na+ efflux pump permease subunit
MRKIARIARREYIAAVHTKAFLIGLVVAPLFMGGSFIAMAVFKDRVDTKDKVVAVLDHSGLVAGALAEAADNRNAQEIFDESGKQVKPAYVVEVLEPDTQDPAAQKLALSDRVREGDLHAFVEIRPEVLTPVEDQGIYGAAYHAENAVLDDIRHWVAQTINNHVRFLRRRAA